METNLVSVIIPTYNRAYCIARAIDSVAAQTHRQLDIIVVDDGSTDATIELVRAHCAADPRIRLLCQPNRGVSGARNTGLRAARGGYVAFLDSDDVWKPWKIELQLRCLARIPQAGMIWSDMEAVDPAGRVLSRHYLRQMYSAYRLFTTDSLFQGSETIAPPPGGEATAAGLRLYWGDIFSPMVMGNLVHTSTVLLRRERQQAVGEFDESLLFSGEDYEFHLRTCRAGPVAFIDVASVEYRVGDDDQLTHDRHSIDNAGNVLKVVTRTIERDRGRIEIPQRMLARRQASLHARVGRAALDGGDRKRARRHMFASLRIRPVQPAAWLWFAFACAPSKVYTNVRRTARALKRAIRVMAATKTQRELPCKST